MALSRSKKIECFRWCCPFTSSSLGYIFLKDEKNSALSFIAQKSSTNLEALGDPNEISCWTYLELKEKYRNKLV